MPGVVMTTPRTSEATLYQLLAHLFPQIGLGAEPPGGLRADYGPVDDAA
jgi:hypothetical protein